MSRRFDTGLPPAIQLIRNIRGKDWSLTTHRSLVLLITFVAYACYHASRKPSSIVKSVWDPDFKKVTGLRPWPVGPVFVRENSRAINTTRLEGNGWAPFNGDDGTRKLGEIDLAFLFCYALGMYPVGHLGDRLDLRLFLTTGMIGSGFFVALFGMGHFWNIHVFGFYLSMQMLAGVLQATGWPSVVAVVGNWFGKGRRGLIMGIWNAHTSVGNITGSLIAAGVLNYGWGWSFILTGALLSIGGVMVYLFLVAYPGDVGFLSTHGSATGVGTRLDVEEAQMEEGNSSEDGNDVIHKAGSVLDVSQCGSDQDVISGSGSQRNNISGSGAERGTSVGLIEACQIPEVIPYALCLFFSKLVAYTFLYWLPFYLSQTAIGGEYMSVKSAGNLSTLFDVGGIVGGILAGHLSDKLNARAITAASFMFASIPSMILYRFYGNISQASNVALMMVAGLFVNGPYALITTAVSADLGTHGSVKGDSRALATVTGIIDGTGSMGAAFGPLLTGFLSTKGWTAVFVMLAVSALIAVLLLSPLVTREISEKISRHRLVSSVQGLEATASEPLLSERRG